MDSATSLRSALPLLLVAALSGSTAWAFFGDRGVLANRALETEQASRQLAVERRKETVAHLRLEIDRMRTDPAVQERWAREELGYVRKGELIYLFPGDRSAEFEVLEDRRLEASQLGKDPK